jgi:hypothetical protein
MPYGERHTILQPRAATPRYKDAQAVIHQAFLLHNVLLGNIPDKTSF